jgi:hypothetical protein
MPHKKGVREAILALAELKDGVKQELQRLRAENERLKYKEETLRVAFEQVTDICGDILNGERKGLKHAIGDIEVIGTDALKALAEEEEDE